MQPDVFVLHDSVLEVTDECRPPAVGRLLPGELQPDPHEILAVVDTRPDIALADAGKASGIDTGQHGQGSRPLIAGASRNEHQPTAPHVRIKWLQPSLSLLHLPVPL